MKVEKGAKLLIIRYSDFLIKGCIRLHMDVLDEKGYVWFGKVGKQKPSDKFVMTMCYMQITIIRQSISR